MLSTVLWAILYTHQKGKQGVQWKAENVAYGGVGFGWDTTVCCRAYCLHVTWLLVDIYLRDRQSHLRGKEHTFPKEQCVYLLHKPQNIYLCGPVWLLGTFG